MKRLYTFLVTWFIRFAVRFARARGRVVHYTHKGQLYMTRYALWGHLTGDGQSGWRARLPNLYIHQMHAPDLDPALHDHPWPWAVSWVMLGGYCEDRFKGRQENDLARFWGPVSSEQGYENSKSQRRLQAPAFNLLRGSTFHRLAALANEPTFTLFLAGPRAGKKPWGYIVYGRGYVSHQERHAEFDGQELREPSPATGRVLDLLGLVVGLERRKRCRWFGLRHETDQAFRARIKEATARLPRPDSNSPEHFWSVR